MKNRLQEAFEFAKTENDKIAAPRTVYGLTNGGISIYISRYNKEERKTKGIAKIVPYEEIEEGNVNILIEATKLALAEFREQWS